MVAGLDELDSAEQAGRAGWFEGEISPSDYARILILSAKMWSNRPLLLKFLGRPLFDCYFDRLSHLIGTLGFIIKALS